MPIDSEYKKCIIMLENNGDNFIAGLMIGGLVGVSVALLLAPQAGEETRAEIKNKSYELKNLTEKRLQGALEKSQQRAVKALSYGKERVIEAISRGKDTLMRTMSLDQETVTKSVAGEAEHPA
jgi:gas vesicle protein